MVSAPSAHAVPVDLELILATDTSGSVDATDFSLRRSGIEAAFRDANVIAAIEGGAIGSIAVTLWDFGLFVSQQVPWTQISDAASSNAFADLVIAAPRGSTQVNDNQTLLIETATNAVISDNGFEGTRAVLDITSEGAQDVNGCFFNNPVCVPTQIARDAFLALGNTAINAIWMNDRDFFGLDAADIINAFEYGTNNVIGGPGSFQVFAETNTDFALAIDEKLIQEIAGGRDPIPEPSTLLLLGSGLAGLGFFRRRRKAA